jgi:hypothetical protein
MPARADVRRRAPKTNSWRTAMEDLLSNAGNVMGLGVVVLLAAAGMKLWQQGREEKENK